jgi:hypothetical protein
MRWWVAREREGEGKRDRNVDFGEYLRFVNYVHTFLPKVNNRIRGGASTLEGWCALQEQTSDQITLNGNKHRHSFTHSFTPSIIFLYTIPFSLVHLSSSFTMKVLAFLSLAITLVVATPSPRIFPSPELPSNFANHPSCMSARLRQCISIRTYLTEPESRKTRRI